MSPTVALVGERDVVSVSGADAVTYLQGQLSADVAALAVGDRTWSLLLEPQGRIDAWLRVWRTDEQRLLLDVDPGWGDRVESRLRRFLLRVDVTIGVERWAWVGLRGPGAAPIAAAVVADRSAAATTGELLSAPVDWRGLEGVDLLAAELTVPAGVEVLDDAAAEALRISCGWPAMGSELDDTVIPAEAGVWLVEASVSFTKGCYTGQELVARVDSRGSNTPRRLRAVLVEGPVVPPVGTEVLSDGQARGSLSSVAATGADSAVALSLLHRSVEAGDRVELRWPDGSASGLVRELPVDHGERA